MIPRLSRILLFFVGGCYVVSFFLPALYLTGQAHTAGQKTSMVGLAAFFDGFFTLFDRKYAWLANPLAGLALGMETGGMETGGWKRMETGDGNGDGDEWHSD